MEPFKKTTISPGNLDLILSNHNAIKLIIIKNNIEVVRIADNLAINSTGGERKVIWFPDGLPKKYVTDFNINTTTTIAFTLSRNNEVRDVITTTDDEIVDYIRIDEAFHKSM